MTGPVVRQPGEGKAMWFLNGLYEVKASGDETDGALTAMEMTIPAGWGPPPHTHDGGETVYVLEGKIRYHIGDDVIEAGPGSFFHLPAGTWENFEPVEQSRLLVLYTPGGIDRFFDELGEPAERREVPPESDTPPDLEGIMAAAEKYGMEMRAPAQA
jgi:quercetin dioxygenase-like cupin family protein